MDTDHIAILIPLAVSVVAFACTIVVHALALNATVKFVRHERRLGHAGANFWNDVAIVAVTISFAFAAHLIEIALWALLFMMCGEFPELAISMAESSAHYRSPGSCS